MHTAPVEPRRRLAGDLPCAMLAAVLAVWLAGCAASSEPRTAAPELDVAERVARVLAGRYAGPSQPDGPDDIADGGLVRLNARVERIAAGGVEVSIAQRRDESSARRFVLVFRPTTVATRLQGSFSPIDAQNRPVGSCPIEVSVQRDGFVARTSRETCRFGTGRDEVALVKEIAHDGQRLVIGDRVVDPQSGENRTPDRVLQLERVRDYAGWVGVRESGTAWRVAEQIAIQSDGRGLDPEDAAGMPLAITLDLAPYRVGESETPVLRLRVFDSESGQLLGQSWADPLATRIGLALPAVQVGLRLRRLR